MSTVVLVADDSMVVRAFLRKQLGGEDYELIEADGGETALAACRERHPDLVLLDVEMPGMSGYEVLTAMQADPTLASIPVIFLSGRVSASDVATGLRMGAHDYLRKPVETGELLARVSKALQAQARLEAAHEPDEPQAPASAFTEDGRSIDLVTGVLDHDGLEAEIRRLPEGGSSRPLAGLLLDVEGLSSVMESHGELAGNQVLRDMAVALSTRAGEHDVVGRVGPDEFLVLMPGRDTASAERFAADLATAVATSPSLGAGPLPVGAVMAVAGSTVEDLAGLFKTLEFKLALAKTQSSAAEPEPTPTSDAGALPPWATNPRPAIVTTAAPAPPVAPDPLFADQEPDHAAALDGRPKSDGAHEPSVDGGDDETQTGRFRRWIRPR